MSTGTTAEVEVWLAANSNQAQTKQYAAVVAFARELAKLATLDEGATDPAVLEIMGNILTAEDEDAIFAAANAGTTAGKDFTNIPFALKSDGVSYKLSANAYREQGSFPFYSLLRVVNLQTGEPLVLNCGGHGFLSTLYRLQKVNYFGKPRPQLGGRSFDESHGAQFMLAGKATASGWSVLLLKPFALAAPNAPTSG